MAPASHDAFFDPTLMGAGAYNSIGEFQPDLSFDQDVLHRFGEIIRRFNLQNEVGAVYVHRHFQMPRKSIAVTRDLPGGMTITRISSIKSLVNEVTLIGSAFKLMGGNRFQAYEYSTQGRAPFLPTLFLEELARFLNENQLQDVLGIFTRTEDVHRLTEFNMHDLRLSISIPSTEIPYDIQKNASTTAWVYPNAQGSSLDGPKQCNNHYDDPQAPTVRLIETALYKRGIERSWVLGSTSS